MALPTGFRPRSAQERLELADRMLAATPQVRLDRPDDGWAAVNLAVAGKRTIWDNGGCKRAAQTALRRFGLPPLGSTEAPAQLAAPLCTILICTYQRAGMVLDAVTSALMQSWPCQVVVVDDGSTDGTAELLECIEGIELVRLEQNRGKPAALEAGLRRARGEYLMVLDDDDALMPHAVRVLATALGERSDLVGVFGDAIRRKGAEIRAWRASTRLPGRLLSSAVLNQVPFLTGTLLVRTEAWRAAGPVDPRLSRGEDMDMFLRLARLGPMEGLPVATFLHREHDGARGQAVQRWRPSDEHEHELHTLDSIRPVFRERWQELSLGASREEGHAWALGLWQRDLFEEAARELARWPGPWSEAERWIRTRCGLTSELRAATGTLLVIDDGDPGALESLLASSPSALQRVVLLRAPRDPLGELQLHWPGAWHQGEALPALSATVSVRLASSPEWRPEPVPAAELCVELPAVEAVLALAAVRAWTLPSRSRRAGPETQDARARAAIAVRDLLERGDPARALSLAEKLIRTLPRWKGSWLLAAEALEALGAADEARACRARLGG